MTIPGKQGDSMPVPVDQDPDLTHFSLNTMVNGRYRIDEELGRGMMGVVYRGYDTLLGRNVAIKILRKESLGVDGYFRLIQEAQTIAKINHPNIVTIYDAGEFEGVPYMVIELLNGEPLNSRIPKTIEEVSAIILQICDALQKVHSYGIVHRDLKPENIMILPDGKIKLMDFGLVHYDTSRITREGEILGTVYYLSPEQAMGKPVDARTDIYALGVLTYELTTGQLPFSGDNLVSVITQHLYSSPKSPSEINSKIPQNFDQFIIKMMAKSPEDRLGSIGQVIEELVMIQGERQGLHKKERAADEVSIRKQLLSEESTTQDKQMVKSGVNLLLESWRKQGIVILDVASLALIYSSPPETIFDQDDALLLTRSVLHRQIELDPWLARAGSPENAVSVLEKLLDEYPKSDIRMKIVRGLESIKNEHAVEVLQRIAASDDAPAVRSEAAVAAARLGKLEQVISGLLENMANGGDVTAISAFVAVIDEFGVPKAAVNYPKFTVSINLLQRRLKARRNLIRSQGIRSALGGALFLAANGLAAPFLIALTYPAAFQETLAVVTVPIWMIIGAFGLLIIGALQGFASGLAVGFADAIWRNKARRILRLIFGGLSGLVMGAYLVLFTLMGAISPYTDPSIYYPVYIIYGLMMGAIITIVIPHIDYSPGFRNQLIRAISAGLIASILTVPYVYLVYGSEAPKYLLSRILISVMLIFGIAIFLRNRKSTQSVQ